jgi:hypothetical protein
MHVCCMCIVWCMYSVCVWKQFSGQSFLLYALHQAYTYLLKPLGNLLMTSALGLQYFAQHDYWERAFRKMRTLTRHSWMEKVLKMVRHMSKFEMILLSICGGSWCSVVCLFASCMNYVVSWTFVTIIFVVFLLEKKMNLNSVVWNCRFDNVQILCTENMHVWINCTVKIWRKNIVTARDGGTLRSRDQFMGYLLEFPRVTSLKSSFHDSPEILFSLYSENFPAFAHSIC